MIRRLFFVILLLFATQPVTLYSIWWPSWQSIKDRFWSSQETIAKRTDVVIVARLIAEHTKRGQELQQKLMQSSEEKGKQSISPEEQSIAAAHYFFWQLYAAALLLTVQQIDPELKIQGMPLDAIPIQTVSVQLLEFIYTELKKTYTVDEKKKLSEFPRVQLVYGQVQEQFCAQCTQFFIAQLHEAVRQVKEQNSVELLGGFVSLMDQQFLVPYLEITKETENLGFSDHLFLLTPNNLYSEFIKEVIGTLSTLNGIVNKQEAQEEQLSILGAFSKRVNDEIISYSELLQETEQLALLRESKKFDTTFFSLLIKNLLAIESKADDFVSRVQNVLSLFESVDSVFKQGAVHAHAVRRWIQNRLVFYKAILKTESQALVKDCELFSHPIILSLATADSRELKLGEKEERRIRYPLESLRLVTIVLQDAAIRAGVQEVNSHLKNFLSALYQEAKVSRMMHIKEALLRTLLLSARKEKKVYRPQSLSSLFLVAGEELNAIFSSTLKEADLLPLVSPHRSVRIKEHEKKQLEKKLRSVVNAFLKEKGKIISTVYAELLLMTGTVLQGKKTDAEELVLSYLEDPFVNQVIRENLRQVSLSSVSQGERKKFVDELINGYRVRLLEMVPHLEEDEE